MQPGTPYAAAQPVPPGYPSVGYGGPPGNPVDLNPYAQIPGRIVVAGLSKQFRAVRAVDNLSFSVEPGTVTGFLGPNGAGKTTTLRMLLGLMEPTAGVATIGGYEYQQLANPLRIVGASLEASSFHMGRSGRNHLRIMAAAADIPEQRIDEVLALVGLTSAAKRKVKGYSLGMRQRLALATALLGDPHVLIMDEPANGLDPEGIRWLRNFLQSLASQGRTVLVSSHLLAEVAQTVNNVVIIAHGRSIRQGKVADLIAESDSYVRVRTSQIEQLVSVLGANAQVRRTGVDELCIDNMTSADVGKAAYGAGISVNELTTVQSDLEEVFLRLTSGGAGIR
jgi:ABC-2 type transport system ATP-binding protein